MLLIFHANMNEQMYIDGLMAMCKPILGDAFFHTYFFYTILKQ